MRQPKRDKTVISASVVAEINDFAKTNLSESDLKAFNLHCFSDTGLGVHTCNPLAPNADGTIPPADDESYCSLHFICAAHLGARYGVGLKDSEPYDFDKSLALCKKLGYETLVRAIRDKQRPVPEVVHLPVVPAAAPVEKPAPVVSAPETPVAPKVRPRRLQAEKAEPAVPAEQPVLTLPTAEQLSEANKVKPVVVVKPAKAVKAVKAAKAKPAKKAVVEPAKKAKPAKKAAKVKPAKKAVEPVVKAKPAKKAAKAKPVKPVKAVKVKPAKQAAVKLVAKAKAVKPVLSVKGQRGRPRTREFDPAVHCPSKKPTYWRTIGAVKAYTPDHKLSVGEVHERLLVAGFRANKESRMGVLLDRISKRNGGATLAVLQAAWEASNYNTASLTHILKIAVKVGAFAMSGDKFVLGGHA